MIVTIHQPNYLPWLGYFHKLLKADRFILLDTVAFSKGSYTNRCRIGWEEGSRWLTVPVQTAGRLGQPINEVNLDGGDWHRHHLANLRTAYGGSPYADRYLPDLESVLESGHRNLADLNESLLRLICGYLGIGVELVRASDLNPVGSKSELLVSLCRQVGASTYLSGQGGATYNDDALFSQSGIQLTYDDFEHPVYAQAGKRFHPGLSILDLLFNCGEASGDVLSTTTAPAAAAGGGAG